MQGPRPLAPKKQQVPSAMVPLNDLGGAGTGRPGFPPSPGTLERGEPAVTGNQLFPTPNTQPKGPPYWPAFCDPSWASVSSPIPVDGHRWVGSSNTWTWTLKTEANPLPLPSGPRANFQRPASATNRSRNAVRAPNGTKPTACAPQYCVFSPAGQGTRWSLAEFFCGGRNETVGLPLGWQGFLRVIRPLRPGSTLLLLQPQRFRLANSSHKAMSTQNSAITHYWGIRVSAIDVGPRQMACYRRVCSQKTAGRYVRRRPDAAQHRNPGPLAFFGRPWLQS